MWKAISAPVGTTNSQSVKLPGELRFLSRQSRTKLSLRIPRDLVKRLKIVCFANGMGLQDACSEAIQVWLEQKGELFQASESDMSSTPTVYFIQGAAGGPIKIGVSVDPENRIKELQIGSSDKLRILGTRPVDAREPEIHALFATERISGEWFRPSARLLMFINHFCAG